MRVELRTTARFWTKKATRIGMTLDKIQNTGEPADCSGI